MQYDDGDGRQFKMFKRTENQRATDTNGIKFKTEKFIFKPFRFEQTEMASCVPIAFSASDPGSNI